MNYATGERELEPVFTFGERYQMALLTLRELMGYDELCAWEDTYPDSVTKGEFLKIMQAKIAELQDKTAGGAREVVFISTSMQQGVL